MKSLMLNLVLLLLFAVLHAQERATVNSPDQKLKLHIKITAGMPSYSIDYAGSTFLDNSPLGLVCSLGDFQRSYASSAILSGN